MSFNAMLTNTPTLSISCVIYDTDYNTLEKTIASLYAALSYAQEHKSLNGFTLYLINNAPIASKTFVDISLTAKKLFTDLIILDGHGNIGYGRGNNLAIHHTQHQYHLILNPDVIIERKTIHEGLSFLELNNNVALVTPHATNEKGVTEYLAKREPSALVIFLRGLNNSILNQCFEKTLSAYAYKDKIPTSKPMQIELASGCFMLCRTTHLQQIGGFSAEYFLYFEDFDLSRKLRQHGFNLYLLPKMNIVHAGGNTARKGFNHIKTFLKSYWLYRKNS